MVLCVDQNVLVFDTEETSPYRLTGEKRERERERERQLGGRDKRREREGDEGKGCIQMIILSMHITTLHF